MDWRPGYKWKDFGFSTLRRPLQVGAALVRIKLTYQTLRTFNGLPQEAAIDAKAELDKIDHHVLAAARRKLNGVAEHELPDFLTITLDDLEREK